MVGREVEGGAGGGAAVAAVMNKLPCCETLRKLSSHIPIHRTAPVCLLSAAFP